MALPTRAVRSRRRPGAPLKAPRAARAPRGGVAGPAFPAGTRGQLLRAAAELFGERGPDGVSVRELCARAGANVAAVNYHFGGKDGLYLELMREGMRFNAARMAAATAQPEPDPARRLVRHIMAVSNVLLAPDAPAWSARLMLRELGVPTPALGKLVEEFLRPNFQSLRGSIGALMKPGTPDRTVALHALSVIGQCLHYRHTAPVTQALLGMDRYPAGFADVVGRHIVAVTFAALGVPVPATPETRA